MSRSFRMDEGPSSSSSSSWRRLRRSNSLLLASELAVDSEFATIGPYQRLSQSMQIDSGSGFLCKPNNIHLSKGGAATAWTGKLGKLFTFKGIRGRLQVPVAGNKPVPELGVATQPANKKKRSSWLPDPDRRWPVQGW
ncbi:OLC1v1010843C1 [Oldenlandia corymbosa var. corymbosa]|uniref:OLC1v1010843C1 n=1 Tax=Oldenlandia corymbosa var. corymbosa TaxID=529605 RepID=A0AAV1DSA9_OLDCO|nr:OLC1v1010843C1 [Oldenlandia corymbosa var. corymbosa]